MPPPRASQMLDEDQQERLEKDLTATRNRQSKQNPIADAALKVEEKKKAAAKKKADPKARQGSGETGTTRNP